MSKLQARAALLSTLPAMFSGKIPNLTALQRRRLPAAALLHRPAGRAALSTLSSSTARTSASKKPAASAAVAASQGPITTTISRCTPEMARGRHVFEIAGYSLAKGLGVGNFIQSGTFSVGGHDWCIQYYPDGKSYSAASSDDSDSDYSDFYVKDDEEEEDGDSGYISVFLARLSNGVGVRALCGLSLVNPAAGLSPELCSSMNSPVVFSGAGKTWGFGTFKERSELETSEYVKDDCLTIQCDISVVTGTTVSQSEPMSDIQVPPSSDLSGKI